MDAKSYLKQIKKLDSLIKNKAVEIKLAEVLGIYTENLTADIESLQAQKQEIINNIQFLTEEEYDVLHKVYVQGKTLYEVAADRDISYSLATAIHGRALKNLAKTINI